MFFLQGSDNKNKDMLHTVIEGNPKLVKPNYQNYRSVYKNPARLDKFVAAKHGDLIGSYLGQTTLKTQKLSDECKGVLFIDEAYSLVMMRVKIAIQKSALMPLLHILVKINKTLYVLLPDIKQLKTCFFNYNHG